MIRTVLIYLAKEVRPRWREIATEPECWLAMGIAVAAAIWGTGLDAADAKVGDIVTVVLAYAAVAFGFCLTGLTVAMTLPDERFATSLAKLDEDVPDTWRRRKPEGFSENAYSKLLFVFSWTAFLHWMAIATAFTMLVARGYDARLLPDCPDVPTRVLAGALVFFVIYAAGQFLVTLITLSQVGSAYITQLRGRQ